MSGPEPGHGDHHLQADHPEPGNLLQPRTPRPQAHREAAEHSPGSDHREHSN